MPDPVFEIYPVATLSNFDAEVYLRANPDVQIAVQNGECPSARYHFTVFGMKEGRRQDNSAGQELIDFKAKKMAKIRQILRDDLPFIEGDGYFDFLTPDLRNEFSIIDTHAVSSNDYDFLNLIERHKEGLVLDCGAGSRKYYYPNVVNFEIAYYPSTDKLGLEKCYRSRTIHLMHLFLWLCWNMSKIRGDAYRKFCEN